MLSIIDKREIGLHKLIMEAGDIIAQKHMEEYVNRCVVKFILSESKYGYIGSGISDVFERYYEMFNDNTWNAMGIFNPRKFLNFVLKYFGEKRCYP